MRPRTRPTMGILVALIASTLCFASGCATRDIWQKPEHVIDLLEIQPGASVADIGAGDGYFIPYLAEAVGPDGIVYAVDVEAEKVEELKELVADRQLTNVKVVLAPFDDPMLPDGKIDLVVLVNTFHHIDDRAGYFARIREVDLSDDGRVAVIEPDADAGGVIGLLVGDEHASSASAVRSEMGAAGYGASESHDDLRVQIFEVFRIHAATDP